MKRKVNRVKAWLYLILFVQARAGGLIMWKDIFLALLGHFEPPLEAIVHLHSLTRCSCPLDAQFHKAHTFLSWSLGHVYYSLGFEPQLTVGLRPQPTMTNTAVLHAQRMQRLCCWPFIEPNCLLVAGVWDLGAPVVLAPVTSSVNAADSAGRAIWRWALELRLPFG